MLEVLSFALLMAVGPYQVDDLENSFKSLQEAQGKKDVTLIKKAATETFDLAHKVAGVPEPADAEGKATWKDRVAYAHDIEVQTEYALLVSAIDATPAGTVELIAALEQANPKSKYLDEAYPRYLYALSQTGATAKIATVAEKGLANFPNNDDLLVYMADYTFSRKQPDRALTYARRLVTVLEKHS